MSKCPYRWGSKIHIYLADVTELRCGEARGADASFHSLVLAITYLPFLEEGAYAGFMGTLECRTVPWELVLLLAISEETK